MAVVSSSSTSEQVLQVLPLHEQKSNIGPESIAASADESWDCCQDCSPVGAECNACPCCIDRCTNENCSACATKSLKSSFPSRPFFGAPDDEIYYTLCQLRRHNHKDSAWLLVGDTIYDATDYIAKHPGGMTSILKKSGGKVDCIVDFEFHSKKARKLWKQYKVGKLCPCPSQQSNFGTDEKCTIS